MSKTDSNKKATALLLTVLVVQQYTLLSAFALLLIILTNAGGTYKFSTPLAFLICQNSKKSAVIDFWGEITI